MVFLIRQVDVWITGFWLQALKFPVAVTLASQVVEPGKLPPVEENVQGGAGMTC